jgi:hypothetical protein
MAGSLGEAGVGTNHGTPWRYDREVPALMYGHGVAKAAASEVLSQSRIAPTLAALLDVPPPAATTEPPLPGVE